ncbi:neuropeptide FF receptor 2-like [Montipora capricornis]|uniref:neuropeptide FF receptor 2-like n=1 Tax=Montipora capricornis TaxID=246305 RepID=UPI0035F1C194
MENFTAAQPKQCPSLTEDKLDVKIIKILAYSIVSIVSFFGNSVIIATVIRNRRMQTTVNYLIANMAVSDFFISVFAVPMKISEIANGPRRWLIEGSVGLIFCQLIYFFQDISLLVSIQSLVVIAVDRYRGIVFPYRPAIITQKRCKIVIALVWVVSMSLHSIYFFIIRLSSNNNTTYCIFSWEPKMFSYPKKAEEDYVVVVLVLVVIAPFLTLALLYTRIIRSLRIQGHTIQYSKSRLQLRIYKENVKVIANICAIIIAFALCVLPLFVYGMLFYFVWKWEMPCNMIQFGFDVHFVLFSNAAINPLIYFVFNDRYRRGLQQVLKQVQFCRKDRGDNINADEICLNHRNTNSETAA